jgi:CheY-like chemotaxis protein
MSKKILLIEDDNFLVEMYKTKFEREGYEIVTAMNGGEGLERAVKEKPDLILLDMVLPEKDGYEVLDELKGDKETKDIPVIILSNLGQNGEVKKGKEKGAEDYFIKSNFTPGQLVDKINKRMSGGSKDK